VRRASARTRSSDPWADRFFERIPVAPVWVGLGVAAILVGLFFALVGATGDLGRFLESEERWWEARDGRVGVLLALLAGYLATAHRYAQLGARRYLVELREGLRWPRGRFEAATRGFERLDRGRTRRAGICGALVMPILALLIDRDPAIYFQSWYWGGAQIWIWLVGIVVAWNGGVVVRAILVYGRRFSELARKLPAIDLFDLTPLAPFARQGLRSAIPGLIVISFFALNLLDRAFLWAIGLMGALSLAVVVAALLLPVRGVRQRIRDAKRAELARIHAAIKGDASSLSRSAIAGRSEPVGLADLLAYRDFVESVREWPFDAPTRIRALLYLGIPLGSWLGGAFVERLLDTALG
jgi:hypothetical protein